jgi:hypothetical protein
VNGCAACNGVEGAAHTCPGSGTFVAAEAYAADEVERLAETWPNWRATIHVTLRAPDEAAARQTLTEWARQVMADDLVWGFDFAMAEHEAGAGAQA